MAYGLPPLCLPAFSQARDSRAASSAKHDTDSLEGFDITAHKTFHRYVVRYAGSAGMCRRVGGHLGTLATTVTVLVNGWVVVGGLVAGFT